MLTILLSITGIPLLDVFIWLCVIAGIFYLLWWLVGYLAPPAPFDKILRGILAIAAVVILIKFLLQFLGSPF